MIRSKRMTMTRCSFSSNAQPRPSKMSTQKVTTPTNIHAFEYRLCGEMMAARPLPMLVAARTPT
jgi:hypothetical protein